MDDAQLIRRYVEEGSEAAFSELVGKHMNLVHSAAMRQVGGDFHRANDVTQKVFILLARKAASLTHHTALTGWLYATTHFSATSLMRGERRRKIREEETHYMNELLANPEPEVPWTQLRPLLDGAMFELKERDREAVLWRYFDALPLAELGRKLGVSEDAAKKRVERALDRMRASFARRGAASTTAALALMLANHAVVAAPAGLAGTMTATALAAAAQTGAQASWFYKFLGKTKLAAGVSGAMWVGGILAIPALGVAGYELWTSWHAKAALARENEGYAAQLESFRALKRAASNTRLAVKPTGKAAPPVPHADFHKFLSLYPQARAAILANNKGMVRLIYGSFFRSAGLTPFQVEQFENVVAENWSRDMEGGGGMFTLGATRLPGADQLRAMLGDQGYQQLQDYSQTAGAHFWADVLAVKSEGASFSTDQMDQLAQILAASATAPQTYAIESLATLDWDAVRAQARTLFSDSQWKSVGPALHTLQLKSALARAQQSPGAAGEN